MELEILGHAEAEVLNDFFDNAEENFGDLLPYTDLERCGDKPGRRLRRLRTILEKATGFAAEVRGVLSHAEVKFGRELAIDVTQDSRSSAKPICSLPWRVSATAQVLDGMVSGSSA